MKNKIKIKTNVKCFGQKLPEGNVCLPSTFLFTLDLIGFGFLYWLAWMYEVSLFNYLKKKRNTRKYYFKSFYYKPSHLIHCYLPFVKFTCHF